jgi:DNA-binding MarR family transcriptional regulator
MDEDNGEAGVQGNHDFARLPHEITDEGFLSEMKPNTLRVYLALLRHADYETQQCYPTRRTISAKSGVTFSSISKATGDLEKMGLIKKTTVNLTPIKRVTLYQIIEHPSKPQPEKTDVGQAEKAGPGEIGKVGRGAAEKADGEAIVNPGREAAGNLGHRSRDVDVEILEAETDRCRDGNDDPLSSINCKYLKARKHRLPLATALAKFQASSAAQTLFPDGLTSDFRLKVERAIAAYHETRQHRELPCDYVGCVALPAQKIVAMAAAKSAPLNYLAACLKADLGKEADRALASRAAESQNRPKSDDYAPLDSRTIIDTMRFGPGAFGQ